MKLEITGDECGIYIWLGAGGLKVTHEVMLAMRDYLKTQPSAAAKLYCADLEGAQPQDSDPVLGILRWENK